jgi:hypothetical protein
MARNHDGLPTMLQPVLKRGQQFVGLALAGFLAACGGPRISRQDGGAVVAADPSFKSAKLVYLPRTIAIPADGLGASAAARQGEALSIVQVASVDPVVAILRARDQVMIEDFVSAVPGSEVYPTKQDSAVKPDSTPLSPLDSARAADSLKRDTTRKDAPKPPKKEDQYTSPPPAPPLAQAWVHTLRMTPRLQLGGGDLQPDDGEDTPEAEHMLYSGARVSRTPGWTINIGARDLIRVLDISTYSPGAGQPKGEAQVDFLWRWKATPTGVMFDVESAEFQSLPKEVQQAALAGSITIDTSNPHWSRATLLREPTGWKVTSIDWTYGDDKPHKGW